MIFEKKFRRNTQIAHILIIISAALILTLILNSFKIGDIGIRIFQWITLLLVVVFAIIEFATPFAKVTANYIIFRENPFIKKTILFKNIIRIKRINKKNIIVIFTNESKRYTVNLRTLRFTEREKFIRFIENIAKENRKDIIKTHLN